jgi:hypothetical protein
LSFARRERFKGGWTKQAVEIAARGHARQAHQPSLAKRVKAATPKPSWAKAGVARKLRLGKPRFPAARPTRNSLPTKISKTTPCKVTESRRHGWLAPRKRFDTSGKSRAQLHRRAIRKSPMTSGRLRTKSAHPLTANITRPARHARLASAEAERCTSVTFHAY